MMMERSPWESRERNAAELVLSAVEGRGIGFFSRASLLFVPGKPKTGLAGSSYARRKQGLFQDTDGPDWRWPILLTADTIKTAK